MKRRIGASIAKFTWLRELDANSDPALLGAARVDVEDGPLLVMLSLSARRFYEWFKRDDHSIYETSAALGDDVNWPFDVLQRAKALIEFEGGACLPDSARDLVIGTGASAPTSLPAALKYSARARTM